MAVKIFRFERGAFFGGSLRTSIYSLPDDTRNVLVRIDMIGKAERTGSSYKKKKER